MKKIINIKPVVLTDKILNLLEKKKLIRTFKPGRFILSTKPGTGRLEKMYSSPVAQGGHKVVAIGIDSDKVKLNYHPGNEEFIFIKDPAYKCKDMYLMFGMHKYAVIEKKAKQGLLSDKDIMVIKWPYNKPKSCIFTMLEGTAHCEYIHPGKGKPPYFFVAEPGKLKLIFVKMNGCKIKPDIKSR